VTEKLNDLVRGREELKRAIAAIGSRRDSPALRKEIVDLVDTLRGVRKSFNTLLTPQLTCLIV